MKRLTLIFTACLFLFSVSYAETLASLRTQVRRYVKDTGTTLQRYSDDHIDDLLNEGQRDMVNRSWCIEDVGSITLTASTTYYDLESDVIAIKQVYYTDSGSDVTILEERMLRSLRQENPYFENDSGEPTEYFIRQSTWGANALEMGIRPVPATVSGDTVKYDYFAQAEEMDDDADIPLNGLSHLTSYQHNLSYYAAARLLLIEGSIDRATGYNQLYETGVLILRERIGAAPNYTPSFQTGTR